MNACSKYGYIGADEYEDMEIDVAQTNNLFADDNTTNNNNNNNNKNAMLEKKRVRKTTINVLNIKLGTLSNNPIVATGDPLHCAGCKVIFSNINNFKDVLSSDGKSYPSIPTGGGVANGKWTCEFCGELTDFNMVEEEIPKSNIIDYILEPAPITTTTVSNNNNEKTVNPDSSYVVFCIDVSGSMDSIVEGKKSRIACVLHGIVEQINMLEETAPNRRVAIVTFNGSVSSFGDGTSDKIIRFDGNAYTTIAQIVERGAAAVIENCVSKAKFALQKKILSLDANGGTALGPAIAYCVGLTASVPGSKIVLATDGASNVGIGSVEGRDSGNSSQFYEELGAIAQKNGTTISVLTIKGTDTKLEMIGKLADMTNGEVEIVDPLKITSELKSVLSLPTIATNVTISVKLHKGLYITDPSDLKLDQNYITKYIGNVNEETMVTYEYGKIENKVIDTSLKSLPFQLQITYTTMKGMKCVRVMTMTQEITTKQEVAEEHADVEVLGINMVQTSSKMASGGDYTSSRFHNMSKNNHMKKVLVTKSKSPSVQQQGDTLSAPSSNNYIQQYDSAQVWTAQAQKFETTVAPVQSAPQKKNDETSNVLFQMKQMSSNRARK
ncbi:hypothetical protein SAMD00019534_013120 [Acytostelium subglobosum LB1]|uniref:hypothetical protein n=1 Tax=Acytostelium subglobosum LB1 TaxID=1410327 RepID=UPI000644E27F|nr:hypothetical protein SAMD00019534_013120 [Acytostelium subglobosum LB1]GAM18137.1 hypothetical protein SAMD00019534_013120 [Acytostelium subglobosum LB1]|eukprot:XP_012758733.1 hypothetical protein SAMD00019534_013120 [Acytostelium subglobosum LB1]